MLVKLKDIATVVGGATPSTEHPEYYNGDIIWITPKDLSDNNGNKYIDKGERNITKLGFSKSNTNLIPEYNILISTRAPIGYIAINKKECCTNQGFKSLICNKSKVNVDYLYYLLKTQIKALENLGTGTTFKEVSKEAIENFMVDLPNRKTQDKIVEILSTIDNQIERNNIMVKRLQDLATSTYSRWFNQFEFPNEDGLPYKSNNGEFVYSEKLKRNIPIGWEVKKVIDNNVIVGGTPNRDIKEYWNGDIPWIITEMIQNGIIGQPKEYITSLGLNKSATKIIPQNSVIMAMYGKGTAGRIGFLPYKATTNQACCSIYSDNLEETSLLYFFLNSQNQYLNKIITGSIQQNLNKETIGKLYYILPPKDILKKSNLSNYLLNMCVLENETLLLNNLKSKLLPLLINGQLEV